MEFLCKGCNHFHSQSSLKASTPALQLQWINQSFHPMQNRHPSCNLQFLRGSFLLPKASSVSLSVGFPLRFPMGVPFRYSEPVTDTNAALTGFSSPSGQRNLPQTPPTVHRSHPLV